MKDSKQFWDKMAEKYARRPVKDEETYQQKLSITREYLTPDSSVLEFGCGSGTTALHHAAYVDRIEAIDISDNMIDIARRKAQEAAIDNAGFQQGTLESVVFQDASFDAVLGLNVLHLLDDVKGTIERAHSLLKEGGVFVTSTALMGEVGKTINGLITLMQFVGMAPYVQRLTNGQLLNLLTDAGFDIEREWRTNKESVFIVARKRQLSS